MYSDELVAEAIHYAENMSSSDMRPGTANSDINTLAITYPVPYWVLAALLQAAKKGETK